MQPPPSPAPIRVILADDHDLVRSGLRALLSRDAGIEVVAEASDGQELVDLTEELAPDVVITDVSMPVKDGLSAVSELRARHPALRILMLSMHDNASVVRQATTCGANGYLMKDASPLELEQAVHRVVQAGAYFSAALSLRLLEPSEPSAQEELTPRQVEILTLLAKGRASKQIAYALNLSPKTVDVHRARIMDRLKIGDVASLTRYALRKGLVTA
ncbi:response regulator [Ramlibacter sp. MAHUQ-53]|uniref:response regulator n=1 Tax=unclassified Ramlibacter TaxID=2617605 RepID=UPI00363346A4